MDVLAFRFFNLQTFKASFLLVLTLASAQALGGELAAKQSFPRLGGIYNGKSPYSGYEDPEYHRSLARLDLVVLGFPRGWRRNGTTPRDVAKAIKSRNPSILLGQYTILGEVHKTSNAGEYFRQKISSERGPNNTNAFDWWARDLNGNLTSVYPNTWYVNITEYVRPDSTGLRWPGKPLHRGHGGSAPAPAVRQHRNSPDRTSHRADAS